MIVLVPAYQPDARLPALLRDLRAARPGVGLVVVDDGSGPASAGPFAEARALGAIVLVHPRNLGKGCALRTGLAWIRDAHPGEDVVCADSDGQHAPDDVLRVGDRVAETGAMVLGGRRFDGDVPVRSRLGNAVARGLLRRASGGRVHDTQTGLRGYPHGSLGWLLDVPGDRFEYELRVLLRAHADGRPVEEIPIRTLYLDGNASSHFRPVADSWRVLAPLVLHGIVALGSFLLDLGVLALLVALTGDLVAGVIGARLVSGTAAFLANRHLVHRARVGAGRHADAHRDPLARRDRRHALAGDALRYAGLAAAVALGDVLLLEALTAAGIPLLAARVGSGFALFLAGFAVQRALVFRRVPADALASPAAAAVDPPPAVVIASGAEPRPARP
ncbi:putative flippase GtrA [Clavibacter michiganensis]|uniref:glycosyltransferase family 2 protein n=1 Tax=Clavibacter michiganensis TaxID=28447 RepID=UPI001AE33139|nr:glycosyltransferase family 2 protein [Clavibacter michiganensis]MBP2457637.1 putative flippase GtrA [Clavibacter michiganensis]MDQ0410207.1 putative flippase GtrA [Clavibacter michiganensis]